MKYLVRLFEFAIIAAIIYPVYYLWDTDRVENFCDTISPGIHKKTLYKMVDESGLKMIGPNDVSVAGGKWIALVPAKSSFSGYACEIKGAAEVVASAQIINP